MNIEGASSLPYASSWHIFEPKSNPDFKGTSPGEPRDGDKEGLSLSATRERGDDNTSIHTKDIFGKKLTPQQEKKVEELKQIDRHVRAHEEAHIAAGGPYVRGGPTYSYVVGPDGKRYAVAGEVQIDISPIPGDPDATIRKEETVRRAALAPSDPSPQDLAVAAKAQQLEMEAEMEKMMQEMERMREETSRISHATPSYISYPTVSPVESLKKDKVLSYYNGFSTTPSPGSINLMA